jgi:predicted nucleotidyltransferase
MTDYRELISKLIDDRVDFIIIGGLAARVHGSSRLTDDLDIVYLRDSANIARLVDCLSSLSPYLRGAPPGLPFRWDTETVLKGLNFTLTTSLGPLDVLGEITLGGNYKDLLPYSQRLELFGRECWCLGIERLIEVKQAAGRPKDFEAIAELQAILEEQNKQQQ